MANKYAKFISAINDRKIVSVKVDSYEKGVIVRQCIPFDFGPSRRYKDNSDRYHMYDLDSPDGKHNLSITVDRLLEIEITENTFEPGDYVTWEPNWIVARDWGDYS